MQKYRLIKFLKRVKPDVIFIVIFALSLLIPMSHISNAEKSEQENRILATKPQLIIDNKINEKYGAQFDAWFNDRFYGRRALIKIFSKMKYALVRVYQNDKALFIKRNGWMFNKSDLNAFGYPKNATGLIQNLVEFNNFCEQNNIKFYVMIVPLKEVVYSQHLDKYYGINHKNIADFHRFITEIQKAIPNDVVLYPYTEMLNASKQDYVFFKQAHHWTDFGAYIGYKALGHRIKQDVNDFNIVSLDKDYDMTRSGKIRDDWGRHYNVGHSTRLLNLQDDLSKVLKVKYKYYNNKKAPYVTETRSKYTKLFENNDTNVGHRLFLFGDSQNENLLQFLPYSVKSLMFLRLNRGTQSEAEQYKFMKHYKQELLDFRPDIVVLCIKTSHLLELLEKINMD